MAILCAVVACPGSTTAHMLIHVGSVVALMRNSDVVIAGVVDSQREAADRSLLTQLRDARALGAAVESRPLTFAGPARFEKGQRYVFFLKRNGSGFRTVQERGMVYPCPTGADGHYEALLKAVRGAGKSDTDAADAPIRRALIEALASPVDALRSHAALELLAMTHGEHRLGDAERDRLRAIVASPDFDPGLRAALTDLSGPP